MKKLFTLLLLLISIQVVSAQSAIENGVRNNSLDIRPVGKNFISLKDLNNQQTIQKTAATTVININYGVSDSTDYTVRMRSNNRFPLATTDSFTYRSAIVAFDTLHDYISDTGYLYGNSGTSVSVDTISYRISHKRASAQNDTIILKVLALKTNLYPDVNNILWRDTFLVTSGTGFTGSLDSSIWVSFPINFTVPGNSRFGVQLEYYGPSQDSFALRASFRDGGACADLGTAYSARLSRFPFNTYRLHTFSPTTTPVANRWYPRDTTYADIFYSCNGDTIRDLNEWPYEQNLMAELRVTHNTVSSVDRSIIESATMVYPNPTSGAFNISCALPQTVDATVLVSDFQGRELIVKSLGRTGIINEEINLSSFNKGIYLVRLNTEFGSVVRKVIVN